MKSKTKISKQLERKSNSNLMETILTGKKNDSWKEVAGILSGPRRNKVCINLEEINKEAKAGEIVVVPGKVLSQGDIDKKVKVVAFSFSEKAKEKLLSAKCEVSYILDEIKSNPSAKGIKIMKK
ncbi:MAG: 50S ribosomal protein L18e [Candidatus Pacearchaeota archaeon]|nr:50S ribosomal protein L18e [Candidatus Pacearchaeota archaeon]